MTRLAAGRDTHLEPDEIAAEALHQFDLGSTDPSIRQLAAALGVTPSAIYHHFPSRAAIVQAAVDKVWHEVVTSLVEVVPQPLKADPIEVLIACGVATRRAFLRHHRIAPFMAATPESNELRGNTIALLANVLERMGLDPENAAAAFHAYASYTVGATLFAATRRISNEQLADTGQQSERYHSEPDLYMARQSSVATRDAIDQVVDVSAIDPDRDEQLFVSDLRALIASFTSGPSRPR
jgi:AcrR family transcriptional regulator